MSDSEVIQPPAVPETSVAAPSRAPTKTVVALIAPLVALAMAWLGMSVVTAIDISWLDEVGDMSPDTPAKMRRLLQDGTFERVGRNESLRSDVRIVAATNGPLGLKKPSAACVHPCISRFALQ